jgi:immunity protein 52 of polymorphic toxin system
MNEDAIDYFIRSELPAHSEEPASLGVKFLTTLDALSAIDPIFSDWQVMKYGPAADSYPLATARPQIAAVIEKNAQRDDWRRLRPEWGYTLGAYTKTRDGKRAIHLRINAGGEKQKGDTWLEAGGYNSPQELAVITYPVFKAALLAINASWPPPWACVCAFEDYYYDHPLSPGAALFPYSTFHIPWLAYLSIPLASGLELPPEILTEHTADGGVLMSAVEERLDPANPEHLRRARILAETMVKHTGDKFGPNPPPVIYFDPDTGRRYDPRTGKTVRDGPRGELIFE